MAAGLDPVQGGVNDLACPLAAEDGDLSLLLEMFDVVITPSSRKRRSKAGRDAEIGRLAVPPARSPLSE